MQLLWRGLSDTFNCIQCGIDGSRGPRDGIYGAIVSKLGQSSRIGSVATVGVNDDGEEDEDNVGGYDNDATRDGTKNAGSSRRNAGGRSNASRCTLFLRGLPT